MIKDSMMEESKMIRNIIVLVALLIAFTGCTQETQNKIGRSIKNWTGTDGVLDVYAGEKLTMRFIKIDKLSTAFGTDDNKPRPYRFGYGVLDRNFNYQHYSTNYIFYENPR